MRRRVSIKRMKRYANMRRRCVRVARRTLAAGNAHGWPIPRLVLVGAGKSAFGWCSAFSVTLTQKALCSPRIARAVAAHELGHYRRKHYWRIRLAQLPILLACLIAPVSSAASILATIIAFAAFHVWAKRAMTRHEREADIDAHTIAGATWVMFVRRNGPSDTALIEAWE
jgi:Zn-dependent protease with chaperone function